jgi:hypothetical protein
MKDEYYKNKMTTIFETERSFEAEIVKGLLEENGIKAFIISEGRERDILLPITKLFGTGSKKHYKIFISSTDEKNAKEILKAQFEIE